MLRNTKKYEYTKNRDSYIRKKFVIRSQSVDILPKETTNQPADEKKEESLPKSVFGSVGTSLKLPQFGQVGRGLEEARWPVFLSASILVLALLIWGGLFFYYKSLQKQKDSLNKRADEIYTSDNKEMTAKILNLEKDLKKVKKLIDSHVYASQGLKLLEDYTLPNVQLLDFNLDVKAGTISAKGLAQTYAVLAKQILLLEKQDSIKSVKVSDVSLNRLGGIGFSMELNLKDNFFDKK